MSTASAVSVPSGMMLVVIGPHGCLRINVDIRSQMRSREQKNFELRIQAYIRGLGKL